MEAVSVNYYLHCQEDPESLHLGKSAGEHWTTDASPMRPWKDTSSMLAYLRMLASDMATGWVADETNEILTFAGAAEIISSHPLITEAYQEFC